MVKINQQAPDFCLQDKEKQNICLNNFKGKWIILYFYPKDNTPGCTLEAINFSRKKPEFENLNTVVLGISPDSCESHQEFSDKHNITVALLSDPTHEVLKLYDVWKPKKLYGKEFLGVVRSTYIISPQGRIQHSWTKVKVPGHIETVLQKLTELQK